MKCDITLHKLVESLQSSNVKKFDLHPLKPVLLLLYGFGPDGTLAWDNKVTRLCSSSAYQNQAIIVKFYINMVS